MSFENFCDEFAKALCKKSGLTPEQLKAAIKENEKFISMSRFHILRYHAIMIVNNARYFPLWTRLKLAKYIIFGGK